MDNLVITSVHMDCEFKISPEGIPYGLGGTAWNGGEALKVPVVLVYIVSICSPILAALVFSACPLFQNISAIKSLLVMLSRPKG